MPSFATPLTVTVGVSWSILDAGHRCAGCIAVPSLEIVLSAGQLPAMPDRASAQSSGCQRCCCTSRLRLGLLRERH
jgi:hypothetical protein